MHAETQSCVNLPSHLVPGAPPPGGVERMAQLLLVVGHARRCSGCDDRRCKKVKECMDACVDGCEGCVNCTTLESLKKHFEECKVLSCVTCGPLRSAIAKAKRKRRDDCVVKVLRSEDWYKGPQLKTLKASGKLIDLSQ